MLIESHLGITFCNAYIANVTIFIKSLIHAISILLIGRTWYAIV